MADLGKLIVTTLDELEENLGARRLPLFVEHCETQFLQQVNQISQRVIQNRDLRFVFLSGPTSSGKTTFTERFTDLLTLAGHKTHRLSLDDYYLTGEITYDAAGRPDFESIETLELDLLFQHLELLAQGQAVNLPTFVFTDRSRIYEPSRILQLEEQDILMIEGLHALAPQLTDKLNHDQYLSIFIMPYGHLHADKRLLDSRDIRILRRISRDVIHRGTTALSTIDYWPVIENSEREFVPDYLARADLAVNSVLPYEYLVVAPLARVHLEACLDTFVQGTLPGSSHHRDANGYADLKTAVLETARLADACSRIPAVDPSIVPPFSILQEFV